MKLTPVNSTKLGMKDNWDKERFGESDGNLEIMFSHPMTVI